MTRPGLPQGTRDFGPDIVRKRRFIFNTIRSVFERYGFEPLETPAMEWLETLLGKYGDEGDQLIFKILNNGLDNPSKKEQVREAFEKVTEGKNMKLITERALRYDLTIPFARYVATNHHQLAFPFKRYQYQPVWRADRPQKGRYREFYQCDADTVGSKSLLNEVEFTQIYASVFKNLGIDVEIRINHRKILTALAVCCGGSEKLIPITVAIDKLDKIGPDKVRESLLREGLSSDQLQIIEQFLAIHGSNTEKLDALGLLFKDDPAAIHGIGEMKYILSFFPGESNPVIDLSLARGLDYYTGIIFEVKAKDIAMGSIGGGGRYDDLTGLFGLPDIAGVGISFGIDRIYDVMEELKLFPDAVQQGTQVLFFNLGKEGEPAVLALVQSLRKKGFRCEFYPEPVKFDKQFKYAEKKLIPFAVFIGTTELASNCFVVKNLQTGKQEAPLPQDQLLPYFEKALAGNIS
jgi:histidyl-tRNA synthetase